MSKKKTMNSRLFLPALKGRIGKWFYYSTLMKFSEAAKYVSLTADFYENERLSDMLQREVNKGRSEKIADYIQEVEERFFSSMVIAVYEGAPRFHEFDVSQKQNSDLDEVDLSKSQSFGYLELSGKEILFPLDGQHRLSGIKKVLNKLKDDPDSSIPDDELSVILIGHEASTKGRQRSRRLFTTLNKRAVTVKDSEIIALDEDDVMAITCRHMVEDVKGWNRNSLIALKANASLSASDNGSITSIVTLYHVFQTLFMAIVEKKLKESEKEKKDRLKFNRPSDEWLEVYLNIGEYFLSQLASTFPEIGKVLDAKKPETEIARHRNSNGGHILFRPQGLRMFAELVAASIKDDGPLAFEGKDADPSKVKRIARKRIRDGVAYFSDIETDITKRPYRDLFFEPISKRIQPGKMALSRDLLLYQVEMVTDRQASSIRHRLEKQMGEPTSLDDFLDG